MPLFHRLPDGLRELRAEDGSRVRHKRVAETDEKEVAYEDLVKGYEIAPDQYVVMTITWITMLVAHIAAAGTLALFSRAKIAGMSRVRAAADITSAQISAQAR